MSSTTPITVENITDGPRKGATRESHESYGMIGFARMQGGENETLTGAA